jgi:hypothetical protein
MMFIAADRTGAGATADAAPAQRPAQASGAQNSPVLAGLGDDFRPEVAGIFRVFAASPAPAVAADSTPVPLPARRPGPAARTNPPVLAYSVSSE